MKRIRTVLTSTVTMALLLFSLSAIAAETKKDVLQGSIVVQQNSKVKKRFLRQFARGECVTNPAEWGKVSFDLSEIQVKDAATVDVKALAKNIAHTWSAWLRQDSSGFSTYVADDLVFVSQQTGKHAVGLKNVLPIIEDEWSAYERPSGTIAMSMEVKSCTMEFSDNTAKVQYWLMTKVGYRWEYDGQALVNQFYRKINGVWKMQYHQDSWQMGYDLENKKPGKAKFKCDFVHPVKDLKRALKFYVPLFGEPEYKDQQRATFNLEGPRFHLDTSTLGGRAEVRQDLPNGYAIIYVDDLARIKKRLEQSGVTFPDKVKMRGPDKYLVCEDPSKNIFLLMQKIMTANKSSHTAKAMTVNISKGKGVQTTLDSHVATIMQAWVDTDLKKIKSYLSDESAWFDDTRSKAQGPAVGIKKISSSLEQTWNQYDRLNEALMVEMDIDILMERNFGKWKVISYKMLLKGKGAHPFKDHSHVTQVFTTSKEAVKLLFTNIAVANKTGAMVVELDYTGYPTNKMAASEKFYTDIVQLGKPYEDDAWKGYWTNSSVFGIFSANFKRDGIPQPHKSNGYASLWVKSAKKTYDILKKSGSRFIKIESINPGGIGISYMPGYTQIVATDSEGNVILFTEYPGD